MDPHIPSSFNLREAYLSTSRTYRFVDQKPANYTSQGSQTILCMHGFPDFWYGWRFQIAPWTRAGYRVIVPDMLGYGGTSKPDDAAEYTTKRLTSDIAALLDFLEVQKAIIVGHDWGAFTASRFALWHPNRLLALILLSVPYTPPSPRYISIQEVAKLAPEFSYQVYFADQVSTGEIEANLFAFLQFIYSSGSMDGSAEGLKNVRQIFKNGSAQDMNKFKASLILSKEELRYYHQTFQSGMNGPLSYYRTSKFRHEEEKDAHLPTRLSPDLPVLFMYGTDDSTVAPWAVNNSRKFVSRLDIVPLQGVGHWVMAESASKDIVTNTVLQWLEGNDGGQLRGKL